MEERDNMNDGRSFFEKERLCEFNFKRALEKYGQFWHVCTPGLLTEIINVNDEDYRFSVSNMAVSALEAGVVIVTDSVMANHIHAIVGGTREQCIGFIDLYRYRQKKYLDETGRFVDLSAFSCDDPILITDLEMMRAEIAYVNRNGFVADRRYTPFTYPWGSGYLYFNPLSEMLTGVKYEDLTYSEKRRICRRSKPVMSDSFLVEDGMILPSSYADFKIGESFFRDAHHYFSEVSKNVEAYCASARRIGDRTILGTEEMYSAVRMLSEGRFNVRQPSVLPPAAKIEVARTMKYDYHATNAQIRMILKMSEADVAALFPKL